MEWIENYTETHIADTIPSFFNTTKLNTLWREGWVGWSHFCSFPDPGRDTDIKELAVDSSIIPRAKTLVITWKIQV